jgi:hypothetical protein
MVGVFQGTIIMGYQRANLSLSLSLQTIVDRPTLLDFFTLLYFCSRKKFILSLSKLLSTVQLFLISLLSSTFVVEKNSCYIN